MSNQKKLFLSYCLNYEKIFFGILLTILISFTSTCNGATYDALDDSDFIGTFLKTEPENFEGYTLNNSRFDQYRHASDKTALKAILELLTTGKYKEALMRSQDYRKQSANKLLALNLIAASYMSLGDNNAAITNLNAALKISPADPMASEALAALAMNKGNYKKARRFLERSLNANPNHLGIMLGFSRLASRGGEHNKAIDVLMHAEELYPQKSEIKLLRIRELISLRLYAQAHDELSKLQKKHPDSPVVVGMLGKVQLTLNQTQEGIISFNKLIKLQPNSASVYYMLALAYAKIDNLEKFNESLNRASIIDPSHVPTNILIIRQAAFKNNYTLANDLLEKLKQRHPKSAVVYAQDGWLAEKENQPKRAVKSYQQAVVFDPESAQLVSRLALAQMRVHNIQESTRILRSWIEKHPKSIGIRLLLAEIYHKSGDKQNAVIYYESVLAEQPKNARVLNNLAWLLMYTDSQRAEEYGKKALDLVPNNPQAMDTMGMVLLKADKLEQSLKYLRNASEKLPDDLLIRYHLIQANYEAGNVSKAKTMLVVLLADENTFAERSEAEALFKKLSVN